MKIAVGISGASGAHLGLAFIKRLPKDYTINVVLSKSAKKVLKKERTPLPDHITIHSNKAIEASISSGSYGTDITAIIPCSMNTLAKIACGIADNLITRSAAVAIKERKTLLVAPRELPLSPIALKHMYELSRLGVIVAPPIAGYYADIKTLEDMEDFLIGKWFDQLGIKHTLYKRWKG